jgi:hypothetical protein
MEAIFCPLLWVSTQTLNEDGLFGGVQSKEEGWLDLPSELASPSSAHLSASLPHPFLSLLLSLFSHLPLFSFHSLSSPPLLPLKSPKVFVV